MDTGVKIYHTISCRFGCCLWIYYDRSKTGELAVVHEIGAVIVILADHVCKGFVVKVSDIWGALPFINYKCSGVTSGVSVFRPLNFSSLEEVAVV